MLNMSIDNNTNSLPFLLYMQEQEQKEKEADSGNEKNKLPFGEGADHH